MAFSGKYFLQGTVLHKCTTSAFDKIHQSANVYEVIRIIDGVPLFFEKHCIRLIQSATYIDLNINLDFDDLLQKISIVVLNNDIYYGNLKIVLQKPGSAGDLFIFFIPHNYPDAEEYEQGVDLISLSADRNNPNAKISNPKLRGKADQIIKEQVVQEVLFVHSDGFITEGSRSNIFLVKNMVVSTPALSQVLPGITREMVMEICRQNGISLHETKIEFIDLKTFEGAFITGTSAKVLPVRKIDDLSFQVDTPCIRKIMKKYNQKISNYLSDFNLPESDSSAW